MRRFLRLLVVPILFGFLVLPRSASGCPMCAESVPQKSDAEETDQQREASAYNFSIFLMAGTPFLLLAGFGFRVVRALRRQSAAVSLAAQGTADEGGRLWLPHSPADDSLPAAPPQAP